MIKFNFILKVRAFHAYYLNRSTIGFLKNLKVRENSPYGLAATPKQYVKWTVLKSPHVDKKARNQYEQQISKRLLLYYIYTKAILTETEIIRLLQNFKEYFLAVELRGDLKQIL